MNEQDQEQQQRWEPSFFSRDPEYLQVNEKPVIGIVGHGFVGKAVERALHHDVDRFLVDPNYSTTIDQLIGRNPLLTFVCTPTPTRKDAQTDSSMHLSS
jgi:hypothetical protein